MASLTQKVITFMSSISCVSFYIFRLSGMVIFFYFPRQLNSRELSNCVLRTTNLRELQKSPCNINTLYKSSWKSRTK